MPIWTNISQRKRTLPTLAQYMQICVNKCCLQSILVSKSHPRGCSNARARTCLKQHLALFRAVLGESGGLCSSQSVSNLLWVPLWASAALSWNVTIRLIASQAPSGRVLRPAFFFQILVTALGGKHHHAHYTDGETRLTGHQRFRGWVRTQSPRPFPNTPSRKSCMYTRTSTYICGYTHVCITYVYTCLYTYIST